MWLEMHTNYKEKTRKIARGSRCTFHGWACGCDGGFRNLEVLSFSTERVCHGISCIKCIVFVIISFFLYLYSILKVPNKREKHVPPFSVCSGKPCLRAESAQVSEEDYLMQILVLLLYYSVTLKGLLNGSELVSTSGGKINNIGSVLLKTVTPSCTWHFT